MQVPTIWMPNTPPYMATTPKMNPVKVTWTLQMLPPTPIARHFEPWAAWNDIPKSVKASEPEHYNRLSVPSFLRSGQKMPCHKTPLLICSSMICVFSWCPGKEVSLAFIRTSEFQWDLLNIQNGAHWIGTMHAKLMPVYSSNTYHTWKNFKSMYSDDKHGVWYKQTSHGVTTTFPIPVHGKTSRQCTPITSTQYTCNQIMVSPRPSQ